MSTNEIQQDSVAEVDAALKQEADQKTSEEQSRLDKAQAQQKRIGRIGLLLRILGSLVILAAAGIFLFQRWGEMSHLVRYLSFLGFTAGVCAAGLVCGLGIKENKGARCLLAIVATLVPVHFAQLGALLYSQYGSPAPNRYPQYFYWAAPSLQDALLALGCGVAALIPMAFISYSVLVRQHSVRFMLANLIASSILLVPTRDPAIISLLIGIVGAGALRSDRKVGSFAELKTFEGAVARLLPFGALSIAAVRQFYLYDAAEFIIGAVLAIFTGVLFGPIRRMLDGRLAVGATELVSLGSALTSCCIIVHSLGLPPTWHYALVGAIGCLTLSFMGIQARVLSWQYHYTAAVVLILSAALECIQLTVDASIISLVMGIVAVTAACISERKLLLGAGLLIVTVSLGDAVYLALRSVTISPWLMLGIVGVTTVVGASYLERNFLRFTDYISRARARVASWK
jgi:hypothetical protein